MMKHKYKFLEYWRRSRGKKNRPQLKDEEAMPIATKPKHRTVEKDGAVGNWGFAQGRWWNVLTHTFTSGDSTVTGIFNDIPKDKMPK